MKKTNSLRPSRRQSTVLRQICELIPPHLVAKAARKVGADERARTFTPWSHVVAMLHAQVSHALSLNDVSDGLRNWCTPLRAVRGAVPPSRNALSHANKVRSSEVAERVLWGTLEHLQRSGPGFGRSQRLRYAWRFRCPIHAVDSTVIQLVAQCMGWAKHRRRKAAAKCHLRLSLRSLLPAVAVVGSAGHHDNTAARELCAGLQAGEIVIFDRAYLDFAHLAELDERGVSFVSRAREAFDYEVVRSCAVPHGSAVRSDQIVRLRGKSSRQKYPGLLRVVRMSVEIDGEACELTFVTNNCEWQPASVGDLFRSRWQIEAFFKQIKQTLQLSTFLGQSANAVKWQVWMALLTYVLLRFIAWQNHWAHSFSRLLTMLRSAEWMSRPITDLLRFCGTASGSYRSLDSPQQQELPGICPRHPWDSIQPAPIS